MKESQAQPTEMTGDDVVEFLERLEDKDIEFWIDGGWGVDALLGEQTRPHGDLDILVRKKDLSAIHQLLAEQSYRIIPRDDNNDIHFHAGDNQGHVVDFTAFEFDEAGNGIYGPKENGEMNPAESFTGEGVISGYVVKCVSPEYQIQFHVGYELDEDDYRDVKALSEKFGIELPKEYAKFNNAGQQ